MPKDLEPLKYEGGQNRRAPFTEVELTSAQLKAWDDTRIHLLWQAPAFSHILYSMMNPRQSDMVALFTKDIPIAATDGVQLALNPDTFFKFDLHERTFICAHEIMHCIWDHCGLIYVHKHRGYLKYPDGTQLPYDSNLMNVATDLVINDLLIESKIGKYNSGWLHDKSLAVATDDALEAYAKVFKSAKKVSMSGAGGGNGQSGFDQHLDPGATQGQDADKANDARVPAEWQQAIAAASTVARAQGKLPAALERIFNEFLTPKVSWAEKIQAFFARKVGSGAYNWRRPDRRLIVRDMYAPGRTGNGAGLVIVAIDTSGSIDQNTLDMFFAEMRGILDEVRPALLKLVWCDAKVHGVDDLEDSQDLNGLKPKGGGGTDFRPVFDWIDEHQLTPDALVYLTDGYGTFPSNAPEYPMLWGSITPDYKYPFGEVVDIPKQA